MVDREDPTGEQGGEPAGGARFAGIGSRGETRLSTGIDFTRPGKQCDFLRLPHSVNRSAYGWLPIPIACIANGEGPTVLLMSGVHGDEYEGQLALTKLIRSLEPEAVSGRIIVLPMANFPAAKAGARVSPIDDTNLNRVFPGDPDRAPTHQLAHYIEAVLMAEADVVLDLHSGGSSLTYLPTALLEWDAAPEVAERQLALAKAFGTPYGCYFPGGHGGTSSSAAAARQGALSLTFELGGGATLSPATVALTEAGLSRALHHLGGLRSDDPPPPAPAMTFVASLTPDSFLFAPDAGLFEPLVELGDRVEAGDLAARLHDPTTPWAAPVEVRFERGGLVLCKRVPSQAERGDCLYHLGTPMEGR